MTKLNDTQVYDKLHDALLELGNGEGETVRGDTALKAARRSLFLLQMGLVKAVEDNSDDNVAISPEP